MPEFTDRLSYLDKRYEHLRKNMQQLKKKISELDEILDLALAQQEIVTHDNDEESMVMINRIIEDIKIEKLRLRDEAAIIRGELSRAITKEGLRKIWTGEARREQQEKDEKEERDILREKLEQERMEAEEKERKEKEERTEMERQRKTAKQRLLNSVICGHPHRMDDAWSPSTEIRYVNGQTARKTTDSGSGYESEYDNEPSTLSKACKSKTTVSTSKSVDFGKHDKVYPQHHNTLHNGNRYHHMSNTNLDSSLSKLTESRNSQDSGIVNGYGDDFEESPKPTMLCFGKWRGSHGKLHINKNVKETAL